MRPTVDQLMLTIATMLATRATCKKLAVGCVLTDERGRILSAGYNGVAAGRPHCTTIDPCVGRCWATHAESNALLSCYAPRADIHVCYVTHSPCVACCKQLIQTGCQKIVFLQASEEVADARDFWELHGRSWLKMRESQA